MAVKKIPCKNHPQRLTTRRCYYCKTPVCSECQVRRAHHIFCSSKCYYLWKTQQIIRPLKKYKHKTALLFLIAFALFSIGQFYYLNTKINRLAKQREKREMKSAPDTEQLWFNLDTTVARANGRISFTITGTPSAAVSIWHNGKMVAMSADISKDNILKGIPLYFGENRFVLWEHRANGQQILVDSFRIDWHSARLRFLSLPLYSVPLRQKLLALTFDAGSTDKGSRNILRVLRNKEIHCTMFVTGRFVKQFPDLVRQMVADGHQIGNHTFNHPHLTTYVRNERQQTLGGVTRRFVFRQLRKTDSLFKKITGRHLAPFWRAPFGEFNKQILRWAAEAGYKQVVWSHHCDALDWVADSTSELYRSAAEILHHFLRLEETSGLQGRIILMHLGTERHRDYPYRILPALIDSLRMRGYRFVTVGQLLTAKTKQSLARK